MPNKTIYVSDDDLPLYQRAQELSGSNLSAAIARALRRYVEVEEGRLEGYDDIIVRVGAGVGRKQRFSGALLGEWGQTTGHRVEITRVYGTRTGKFVVHVDRSADWNWRGGPESGKGWRSYLSSEQNWGFNQGESTLEVFELLEDLKEKIPPELYDMVAAAVDQPAIEDLDI